MSREKYNEKSKNEKLEAEKLEAEKIKAEKQEMEKLQDKYLDKVFDPFFTTKDVGKGTGQGLAIAQDVVRSHGGKIFVESTPYKETQFRILLPYEMN